MDYLPEEKARGITIEAGVAHFEWRNIWFNFIDTQAILILVLK